MAWIIDFSSKNIVSQKVYRETVNQPGHFILNESTETVDFDIIWRIKKLALKCEQDHETMNLDTYKKKFKSVSEKKEPFF